MPKCKCLWVDRGVGYLRNGKYDVVIGEFKKSLFSKPTPFHIPEEFKNIVLDKKAHPFFIIDAKSNQILNFIQYKDEIIYDLKDKTKALTYGINLTADVDLNTALKLKVLIKTSFWEMLAKRLKIGAMMTLIYLGAGYGIGRAIEEIISIVFLHHT